MSTIISVFSGAMVYVHANQAYRPSRAIGKIDTDTVLQVRGDIPIYRGIERVSGRWLTLHKAIASVKVRSTRDSNRIRFFFFDIKITSLF